MKKVISLLLIMVLCLAMFAGCGSTSSDDSSATAKPTLTRLESVLASGVLTVATSPDYAPYEFIDSTKTGQDQYVGADVEVAKYIAEYIGVELVIEPLDFDACQTAVYTGKVDMSISGFAYTAERAENANLSDTYKFTSTQQGIIVSSDIASSLTKTSDFDGLTIAVQNGSLQQTMVTEQLPNAKTEIVTDLNTALMYLMNGKVDGFATSDDVGNVQIAAYPGQIAFADFWLEYDDDGTVVLMQKGEDDLTAIVNEALAKAAEEGYLTTWLEEATALQEALGA